MFSRCSILVVFLLTRIFCISTDFIAKYLERTSRREKVFRLTDEQFSLLRSQFDAADIDGDGSIDFRSGVKISLSNANIVQDRTLSFYELWYLTVVHLFAPMF